MIAVDSAVAATVGEATVRQIRDRLGVAHILEGSFLWQRDAEGNSLEQVAVQDSRN